MGMFSRFGDSESAAWQRRLRRWITPTGHKDPKFEKIKKAAEADVEAMLEEDRKFFRRDAPGKREDEA